MIDLTFEPMKNYDNIGLFGRHRTTSSGCHNGPYFSIKRLLIGWGHQNSSWLEIPVIIYSTSTQIYIYFEAHLEL